MIDSFAPRKPSSVLRAEADYRQYSGKLPTGSDGVSSIEIDGESTTAQLLLHLDALSNLMELQHTHGARIPGTEHSRATGPTVGVRHSSTTRKTEFIRYA